LYAKMKEAEGIQAVYEAQAEGLKRIVATFQGDNRALLNYLMIEKEMYPKLADASARAIQGLNPKITIWNTGNDAEGGANPFNSISNIAKSIPPIIQTIEQQTGLALPDWLVKQNKTPEELEVIAKALKDHGLDVKDVAGLIEGIGKDVSGESDISKARFADITNKVNDRKNISF